MPSGKCLRMLEPKMLWERERRAEAWDDNRRMMEE
jgi:hypothetical protein